MTSRTDDLGRILSEVTRIAPTLHKAGTFSATTLQALVRHASERRVEHSAETGSGASTILLSHLSPDHTVFAVDEGTGSIRGIETLPILRREAVTFVEGPTQLTLPRHLFASRLQLVLIDGPHGYPFPDLEYYFLYQHLDPGALLIVDDIHIPTIANLCDFLSADEMFERREIVETTAFFRRTDAPTFPPLGDGWWTQAYNKRVADDTPAEMVSLAPPRQVERQVLFYLDQLGPVQDPLRVPHVRVPRSEPIMVAGWALDPERRQPAVAVDLVVDDDCGFRATVDGPRADVATAHGDQAYARSGFRARFPPGAIEPGSHTLEMRVVVAGGREYVTAVRVRFEAVERV